MTALPRAKRGIIQETPDRTDFFAQSKTKTQTYEPTPCLPHERIRRIAAGFRRAAGRRSDPRHAEWPDGEYVATARGPNSASGESAAARGCSGTGARDGGRDDQSPFEVSADAA